VVKFVRQLVEGLAYLHERKIAHLDIKVGHDSVFMRTTKLTLKLRNVCYCKQYIDCFPRALVAVSSKAVPVHAMEAQGGIGGKAPTHS
jgi:serine/threonine protein kinase